MGLLPIKSIFEKKNQAEYPLVESKLPDIEISMWDMIWYTIKNAPQMFKALYHIIRASTMFGKDPKTTLISIIQALIIILGLFGVNIAPEAKELITTVALSVYALVGVIKGYFTKDKPSTNPKA